MAKGGARKNAGRKPKANEEHANNLLKLALKDLYKKSDDDSNMIAFLKEFAQTPRGQVFFAEHLIGKPKENVKNEHSFIDFKIKPLDFVNSSK